MAEENGKAKARELVSIAVQPYPDWSGKTTQTEKRFGDKAHKFSITVPVPATDTEAQEIYGISLESLIEAGVVQKWYGARDVDNVISEAFDKGLDPNSEDLLDTITLTAGETKFSAKERTSVSREMKTLKTELSGLGMTPAEAIAMLKKMKAQA